MILDVNDTIVAVASPPGAGERGIIRISGPGAFEDSCTVFELDDGRSLTEVRERSCLQGSLCLNDYDKLPGRMLLWPDHRSYTRQPTIEFHTLGSPVLLQMASAAVCRNGARLAERGEFTLRAFLSGRIDLTQAEAVLAVIDAKGQSQLNNALRQLSGGLSGPLADVRESLIGVLAELEAGLDFVEEDIEFITNAELENALKDVLTKLNAINAQIRNRGTKRDVFSVALIGLPNAGKSSLYNVLVNRQRAIVTNVEGTTRDFVATSITVHGLEVELIDTAGIDRPDNFLENTPDFQAQTQTQRIIEQASTLVLCLDSQTKFPLAQEVVTSVERYSPAVVVLTKCDLVAPDLERWANELETVGYEGQIIQTSSVNLDGLESLRQAIAERLKTSIAGDASVVATTATRAVDSSEKAELAVISALDATVGEVGLEIVASEIRQALEELGSIVGTVYTDDILDQVFGRFCIGK